MTTPETSSQVNNEVSIPRVVGVSAIGAGILNFSKGFEMPTSPEVGAVMVASGCAILGLQKAVEVIRERRLARRITS